MWEHAYYLKHQSRRKDYIEDFFKVVAWAEVMDRYTAITGEKASGKDEM